jgi:serine protease Do
VFNKVCLAYGYNPGIYADLAKRFNLPNSRASRCQSEYQAAQQAVNALHSKIEKREIAVKGTPEVTPSGPTWQGQLGVLIQDMPEYLTRDLGLNWTGGALVKDVELSSHAKRAGIRAQDVILKLNGEPINVALDLTGLLRSLPLSTNLVLSVWRAGQPIEIRIDSNPMKPADTELATPSGSKLGSFGLEVISLLGDQKKLLQIESGVFVSKSTGPAAKAGIVEGDLIIAVRKIGRASCRERVS